MKTRLECSVCGLKITPQYRETVIVIPRLRYYGDWKADAGKPLVRSIVLCGDHAHYLLESMKEMKNESERMAREQGD